MTSTTEETIRKKLAFLSETVARLQAYRALDRLTYETDERNRFAAERLLQTAIESIIDVARAVIVERQLEKAHEIRTEFEVLADAQILPRVLAERLREARKFRNVLVHAYTDIDPTQVYENLQNDLGDLEEFARVIAAYLLKAS